jgi:hypothetical protein
MTATTCCLYSNDTSDDSIGNVFLSTSLFYLAVIVLVTSFFMTTYSSTCGFNMTHILIVFSLVFVSALLVYFSIYQWDRKKNPKLYTLSHV